MAIQTLFSAQTANATSSAIEIDKINKVGLVPTIAVYAYGTWDTSSLQVEISPDGTNFVNHETALTDSGTVKIDIPCHSVRATLSSVGAGTNLNVVLV